MAIDIHGELPAYIVKKIKRDVNGLYQGICERQFEVGPANQRVELEWLEAAPNPWGIPCTDAEGDISNGLCVITYTYQGTTQTFTSTDNEVTFEIDTQFTHDDIETHPKFRELKVKYGWDPERRRFAENIAANGEAAGLADDAETGTSNNPLYGTTSWLAVGLIYRKVWVSRTIPAGIFGGLGTIVKRPPDIAQFKLPAEARKRNWLYVGPTVSRTGNAVRIAQEWMLSGPSGWKKPVYDQAQLG